MTLFNNDDINAHVWIFVLGGGDLVMVQNLGIHLTRQFSRKIECRFPITEIGDYWGLSE